jgi:hypothetical protein
MTEKSSETSGPMPLVDKLQIAAAILFLGVAVYLAVSFVHSRKSLQHPPQPAMQAKP